MLHKEHLTGLFVCACFYWFVEENDSAANLLLETAVNLLTFNYNFTVGKA